jgi:hypothetical protein
VDLWREDLLVAWPMFGDHNHENAQVDATNNRCAMLLLHRHVPFFFFSCIVGVLYVQIACTKRQHLPWTLSWLR